MPTNTSEWEERFDREFGNLILGTLSGDAQSPVFTNNELEKPRLKHFIKSELETATSAAIERTVREIYQAKTKINNFGIYVNVVAIKNYAQSKGINLAE